jgi:hypothetical protein
MEQKVGGIDAQITAVRLSITQIGAKADAASNDALALAHLQRLPGLEKQLATLQEQKLVPFRFCIFIFIEMDPNDPELERQFAVLKQ